MDYRICHPNTHAEEKYHFILVTYILAGRITFKIAIYAVCSSKLLNV